MSDVQRWAIGWPGEMDKYDEGDYVLYTDWVALEAQSAEGLSASAEAALRKDLYDLCYPGEPVEEREPRWKWIRIRIDDMAKDDRTLREMVAINYSGASLCMDDGELQDGRVHPPIDFRRDPVQEIKAKMAQRSIDFMTAYQAKPELTDDELRAYWRSAGGTFYGPRVEHGDMTEALLLPLLRQLRAGLR